MFARLDADGSNQISVDELAMLFKENDVPYSTEDVGRLFKELERIREHQE